MSGMSNRSPPIASVTCRSSALPGKAEAFELAHAPDLAELRDLLVQDAQVTVCTQCAARRGITEADLVAGIRIAGATSFVAEALAAGAQALVY